MYSEFHIAEMTWVIKTGRLCVTFVTKKPK